VSGVEGMGTDDFWSDDAAASQRRASDLRMPPAAIVVPADLMGSNAKPSADYRAMPRKKNFMRLIIGGMIVGVFTVVALNFQYGQAVTLVEFNALRTGMTVEQCNEIVGATAVTVAEAELPPTKFLPQHIRTVEWVNNDKSTAVAGFVDGKLLSKSQKRLR